MIVVTGGTGHIGNVLVRKLLENGEKVRAVVPPSEDTMALDGLDVEIVPGDVCDITSLNEAFNGADMVFHIAGIISIIPGNTDLLYSVNVGGTHNVVKACLYSHVKRLIYTSSVHAFPVPPYGSPLVETKFFNPDEVVGDYAKSKSMATTEVLGGIHQGLDAVIIHPSGVMGPYQYKLSNTGQLVLDYIRKKIPVCIKGAYDFVDVRDVADGLIAASQRGRTGENYILSGEMISIEKIFSILEKVTDIKAPKFKLPIAAAKMMVPFGTVYSYITKRKPIFTSYSLYTLSTNSLMSHEKATRELNYMPRPLEQSISDTVKWFQNIKKI